MNTSELISMAESLPLNLKTQLIDRLLNSLNPSRKEIEELWAIEAEKRVEEIKTGKVKQIQHTVLLFVYLFLFVVIQAHSQTLTITVTTTDVSCYGYCDGTAIANPSGGVPPYTYYWIPGGDSTSIVNNLCGGAYSVFVIDSVGDDVFSNITIYEPAAIYTSFNISICQGDSVFAGGSYHTTTGVYYDTLVAANGCDSVVITELIVNPLPVITVSPSPGLICSPGDTVMLIASGADSYSWSPSSGLDTTANDTVLAFPTSDTIYTIIGTNTSGCVDSVTVAVQIIIGSTVANFSASSTLVCEGDAVIYINTSNDAIGFSWSFQGGTTPDTTFQNPEVIYNSSGVFDVTLTAYGCTTDSIITKVNYITVNPSYSLIESATICSNDSLFIGGAYQNTSGTYYDIFSTADGCDSIIATTLTVSTAPDAGIGTAVDVCDTEFSLDLSTVLSGTPDGGGSWSDDDGSGAIIPFTNLFVPMWAGAGVYHFTYTVSGTSPCSDASATITVTVVESVDAGTSGELTACVSATTVDLTTVLGGTPDTTGTWYDVDATGALTGSIFNPSTAGQGTYDFIYVVTATSPCINDTSIVAISVVLQANAGTPGTLDVCETDFSIDPETGLDGSQDPGGTWNDDDNSGAYFLGFFSPTIAGPGVFHFTYTVSATGCSDVSATVTIIVAVSPYAGTGDTLIDVCNTETAVDLSSGLSDTPDPGGTWTDDDVTGALTGGSLNATAVTAGTYHFTYVASAAGCADDSATVTVFVINCTSGITDNNEMPELKLYPNPTTGRIYIELALLKGEEVKIEVFNSIGELIEVVNYKERAVRYEVDLSSLPGGLYYVKVNARDILVTNKISIIK
ncbi:MAG: T9SS type A sorting domain-containing protein [Bacteroidota bacterium]